MPERITDKLVKDPDRIPERGQRIVFDTEVTGFAVRFSPKATVNENKGGRAFVLDYRIGGQQRRFTIGRYPAWSVEAARIRAKELRRAVDRGEDPMEERVRLRTDPHVRDLADRYRDEHLPSKVGHPAPGEDEAAYRARLEQHADWRMIVAEILPRLGKRRVVDVHLGDIQSMHRAISARGAPVRANRVLAVASKMFSLALLTREGEAEPWRLPTLGNPCAGVDRNSEQGRERFFSEAEIEGIADALAAYPGTHTANLIRFAMLTGCRPGEAIKARWTDMDIQAATWTKPTAHTKQRRAHVVPLAPPAIALLQKARAEVPAECHLVFPGRPTVGEDGTKAWAPLRQYRGCWDFVRKRAKLAPDAEGNAPRPYDLRHTFASAGMGHGLSLYLVGKLLGHTQFRTTQRYAHIGDDPLRKAAEQIGASISNAGREADNVVDMEAAAKGGRGG